MARKRRASEGPAPDIRALPRTPSLKSLADHLGLSPTTLSLVLNGSPVADSIPQETKDRIFAAARGAKYRPNFLARSLRAQRTYTLGVLVPELSDGYSAMVLGGIEDYLIQAGYFYFVASHRHQAALIEEYPNLLFDRSIEGLIAVDTPYTQRLPIPVVAVSGINPGDGITSVSLNHSRAATQALEYLLQLGHRRLAFIKGQVFSSDTEVRWQAIQSAAQSLDVQISPALVVQLEGDSPSPEPGYIAANKLLATKEPFTALFSFNDVSAIGAIRAFREAGHRVPDDISVVGFDDIHAAAYQNPALTTIRQPLWAMGKLAAETLLRRIDKGPAAAFPKIISVEPELVIRQSTSQAPSALPSRNSARRSG